MEGRADLYRWEDSQEFLLWIEQRHEEEFFKLTSGKWKLLISCLYAKRVEGLGLFALIDVEFWDHMFKWANTFNVPLMQFIVPPTDH